MPGSPGIENGESNLGGRQEKAIRQSAQKNLNAASGSAMRQGYSACAAATLGALTGTCPR
jgi:hypothetical protein